MQEDLSRFCCQHPDRPDYGQRGQGNLTVCGHYGKTQPIRLLYCRTCKARFSERKGTPLFRSCLPEDKAIDLIGHLADRNGVRATARLSRRESQHGGPLLQDGGRACPATSTTSSWLFPPRTQEVQFDEKWSFVFKKQEHCDPTDPADAQRGDWWDHTALDAEHKLVLCVVPGARTAEQTEAVVESVKERTEGRPLRLMTSDDYPAYKEAILHVYGTEVTTTPTGATAGGWSRRRCRRRS